MAASIVQTSQNVTLVGAGQASKADLDIALAFAPYLIAADGGAEMVLNYGNTPKKVIGDFDSINRGVLAKIPPADQHHVSEQDSTDFEKCLTGVIAPLILGVGFLGARLDHQLSGLNVLVRHIGSPCILIGEQDLIFHLNTEISLQLEIGTRVSLFPMATVHCQSKGLEWPVDQLEMAPSGAISISNGAAETTIWLRPAGPGLLVVLPKACLPAVIRALKLS